MNWRDGNPGGPEVDGEPLTKGQVIAGILFFIFISGWVGLFIVLARSK